MEPRIWSFDWNDAMSVGIPEIDQNHKRFIELVDAFNESVTGRMPVTVIQKRLQDILDDTVRHFAREARLFAEWSYPGADHHARVHAKLVAELKRIKSKIAHGYEAEWVEAGMKIKDALITHIYTDDMKYAEFYRNTQGASGTGGS